MVALEGQAVGSADGTAEDAAEATTERMADGVADGMIGSTAAGDVATESPDPGVSETVVAAAAAALEDEDEPGIEAADAVEALEALGADVCAGPGTVDGELVAATAVTDGTVPPAPATPNWAFSQVLPHFWYRDKRLPAPHISVLFPLQGMLQVPITPGVGAARAGRLLPQKHWEAYSRPAIE